jgi:mRNA deadenylase 3'-5' endonuclease subunit Ccr4
MRDEIYYRLLIADEKVKTYCLQLDYQEKEIKVKMVQIPVQNFKSDHDVFLNKYKSFEKNYSIDSF